MQVNKNNAEFKRNVASRGVRWEASVARWAVWQDIVDTPDVKFMGAGLRRRLSRLAKMSIKAANDCAGDLDEVRLVYASQHGDLSRTTEMLDDLALKQPLSPTSFSMSVLNAFSGVYSIHKQDQSPSISISSGASSFGFGLLEACLQFQSNPEKPVLFVYSDEPIPDVYQSQTEQLKPHAIAILLSSKAAMQVVCEFVGSDVEAQPNSQSLSFLDCLNGKPSIWCGDGRVWTWARRES